MAASRARDGAAARVHPARGGNRPDRGDRAPCARPRLPKAGEWRTLIPDLTVYVNISVRQLQDPGLVADVHGRVPPLRPDAHRLVLEITESGLMEDVEANDPGWTRCEGSASASPSTTSGRVTRL